MKREKELIQAKRDYDLALEEYGYGLKWFRLTGAVMVFATVAMLFIDSPLAVIAYFLSAVMVAIALYQMNKFTNAVEESVLKINEEVQFQINEAIGSVTNALDNVYKDIKMILESNEEQLNQLRGNYEDRQRHSDL
jgi:ABC-type multidrug transport system fused ATPase/permease subunit